MEHAISRDGTRIAYWRSGVGSPLLLVHGTTADHSRWLPIVPLLEPYFTVYLMDRRGRGESGDTPDYGLAREAEDVAAVVEAIGGRVSVLGHSFGGLVSLEAALLVDNIDRLILYEPVLSIGMPIYSPATLDRIQSLVGRGEQEAALEVFFRDIVEMPPARLAEFRRLPAWKVRVTLAPTIARELKAEEMYRFDAGRLRTLKRPALILLGSDSAAFFHDMARRVDAVLPDSRVVVMHGQGHNAMDTHPELFASEVRRFLPA